MNKISLSIIGITMLFFSGCATVSETDSPVIDTAQKFDLSLRLDGFSLESFRQTGVSYGSGSATAYDWKSNRTVTAYGNSTTAHYAYRPDGAFAYSVTDLFESIGFNIRSENPELVLVGRIGHGRFPWKSWGLWLRDAPVFLIAVPTFASVISCTRENDARVIVYDRSGKRLADYVSEQSYHSFSIGFPFANFANEKAYEWYGDRKAAEFALTDCLKQFVADLAKGRFNRSIKYPVKTADVGSVKAELNK